jgi:hypothetical protein
MTLNRIFFFVFYLRESAPVLKAAETPATTLRDIGAVIRLKIPPL